MKPPITIVAKKIALLGFGAEGVSSYAYIKKWYPESLIGIFDTKEKLFPQSDPYLKVYTGADVLSHIGSYDFAIRSPGFKIPKEILEASNLVVTSQTALFLAQFRNQTIGITGTKGKSTTTHLIKTILTSAGHDVLEMGNIGIPPFDICQKITPETICVYELSSHQLSDCVTSPHIAVLLNIYREHLDYYKNEDEYIEAKSHITTFQKGTDVFVFNVANPICAKVSKKSQAKLVEFSFPKDVDCDVYIDGASIVIKKPDGLTETIPVSQSPFGESAYTANVLAAIAAVQSFGVTTAQIQQALKSFTRLDSRLKNVGTFKSINFYDDSLATIPEATIAAIDSFPKQPIILITGGYDRGQDFALLAQKICDSTVAIVIGFSPTGDRIYTDMKNYMKNNGIEKSIKYFPVTNMKEAVSLVYAHSPPDSICLLSNASASFGTFVNYKERSELFQKYIEELSHAV